MITKKIPLKERKSKEKAKNPKIFNKLWNPSPPLQRRLNRPRLNGTMLMEIEVKRMEPNVQK